MPKTTTNKEEINKPVTKDIIEMFQYLEATSPETACTFEQLGLNIKIYQKKFDNLVKNKVVILADEAEAKFYLNIDNYILWETNEKKKFFLMLVSIIIPGVILILLGIAWIIMVL